MNTLSINTPQPSFKGVIVSPNLTNAKRPLTYLTLRVVPNKKTESIKISNLTILIKAATEAADNITAFFSQIKSIQNLEPAFLLITKAGKQRMVSLQTMIRSVVSHLGLKGEDRKCVSEILKHKNYIIEETSKPDEYKIIFGTEPLVEIDKINIFPPAHTGAKNALEFNPPTA